MAGMTEKELQDFFSSDVLCRLGCLDDAGAPYVVPCWFQYAEGGFYIIPRARSTWANYLRRDGCQTTTRNRLSRNLSEA